MVATSSLLELVGHAKVLVFDFDGTLVDSNPIKWRAFGRCFEEFAEQQEEIQAYCRGNNHTPRGEKFRYVYEQILKLPYTPEVEIRLHRCFEENTTRQIIQAPSLPGAESFLQQVRQTHRAALLSSTPHPFLLQILRERRWTDYFRWIQGAPVDKTDWLKNLRDRHRLGKEELIFFGDTLEDAHSALVAGCPFVAVRNETWDAKAAFTLSDYRSLLVPAGT